MADIHADGGGDALGQQRDVLAVVELQQQGQHQNAAQACQRARQNPHDDGKHIFAQQIPFFVQRHGQADRGGQQQVADRRRAGLIVLVRDAADA